MCTLIAYFGVVPGYPLVVAMNRDELYDRPAVPPEARPTSPKVVAPGDARAQGTWIGVNEFGLVAAVSNRSVGSANPAARSRGLLCLESLAKSDVASATMLASEAPEGHVYNPFNLLHADLQRIACTSFEGGTWTVHGMKGVNVLTNAGLNAGDPREQRVRSLLGSSSPGTLERAVLDVRRALKDHAEAGGRAICHHGEKAGTRSQTLVAVSEKGWAENRLWFADGFPCTADSEERSDLFQEKGRRGIRLRS